jgi:hypothetical protein
MFGFAIATGFLSCFKADGLQPTRASPCPDTPSGFAVAAGKSLR